MSKFLPTIQAAMKRPGMYKNVIDVSQLKSLQSVIKDRSDEAMKIITPLLGGYRKSTDLSDSIDTTMKYYYSTLEAIYTKSNASMEKMLDIAKAIANDLEDKTTELEVVYNDILTAKTSVERAEKDFKDDMANIEETAQDPEIVKLYSDTRIKEIATSLSKLNKVDFKPMATHFVKAVEATKEASIDFIMMKGFHEKLISSAAGGAKEVSTHMYLDTLKIFEGLWHYMAGAVQLATDVNDMNPIETDRVSPTELISAISNLSKAEEIILGRDIFFDAKAKKVPAENQFAYIKYTCEQHIAKLNDLTISESYPKEPIYNYPLFTPGAVV